MLRMKPSFLHQSPKSSGFSSVYVFVLSTALIRLLLVLLVISISERYSTAMLHEVVAHSSASCCSSQLLQVEDIPDVYVV